MNSKPWITIESPCTADWQAMSGNDRVRHCGDCGMNVYNLSALSAAQAQTLIQQHEGQRLCVRYYQRPDGTVLTSDCVRYRAFHHSRAKPFLSKKRLASVAILTLATCLALKTGLAHADQTQHNGTLVPESLVFPHPVVMGGIRPPEPLPQPQPLPLPQPKPKPKPAPVIMGKMAPPPRPSR